MGEPVAVSPATIVVVLSIRRRDGLKCFVEVPQRSVLELDRGHRGRRARHEDVDQSAFGPACGEPSLDLIAEINHMTKASGLDDELVMIDLHCSKYTARRALVPGNGIGPVSTAMVPPNGLVLIGDAS